MKHTIKNNRDYDAIAKRIEELVDAEPRTPSALELKAHIYSIIAYEQKRVKKENKKGSSNIGI